MVEKYKLADFYKNQIYEVIQWEVTYESLK